MTHAVLVQAYWFKPFSQKRSKEFTMLVISLSLGLGSVSELHSPLNKLYEEDLRLKVWELVGAAAAQCMPA